MMFIFVILGLLICTEPKGSAAVSPVFVQRGNDILLDVHQTITLTETTDFYWKCNKTNNILKFNQKVVIFDTYEGRVEFYEQYSVLLKNLQHNDSGDYVAVLTGNKDEQVAEYTVIVEDPVSPVVLTVDSVSISSDPCNLTVTCSTQDPHISSTFTCDTQTCSQEGGERSKVTTSGASLQVYLVNDSIICNHSNQLSWINKEQTKIRDFCPRHDGSENLSAGFSFCLVKTVLFSVGLIIMVSAVISVHLMETFKTKKTRRTIVLY